MQRYCLRVNDVLDEPALCRTDSHLSTPHEVCYMRPQPSDISDCLHYSARSCMFGRGVVDGEGGGEEGGGRSDQVLVGPLQQTHKQRRGLCIGSWWLCYAESASVSCFLGHIPAPHRPQRCSAVSAVRSVAAGTLQYTSA